MAKGSFQLANHLYLKENARNLYYRLQKDRLLQGLNKAEMARKLAFYMAEINVMHPFREGNGRALREYIRTLAIANGYTIDWTKMDKDTLLNAIKLSVIDTTALERLIYLSISPVNLLMIRNA
ncbi:MAG: Fic family protein [Caldibacillus sp.]